MQNATQPEPASKTVLVGVVELAEMLEQTEEEKKAEKQTAGA